LYEGGVRSPLIAWGPGRIEKRAQGTRNKASVFAAIDLVPSLLRLTGADPAAGVTYDGEVLLETLLGRTQASRQAPIFFGRPPDRKSFYGFNELPDLALRQGRWKLLCDFDGARPQLYDLTVDVGESNNLVDKHPEVAEELKKKVLAWHAKMSRIRAR